MPTSDVRLPVSRQRCVNYRQQLMVSFDLPAEGVAGSGGWPLWVPGGPELGGYVRLIRRTRTADTSSRVCSRCVVCESSDVDADALTQ